MVEHQQEENHGLYPRKRLRSFDIHHCSIVRIEYLDRSQMQCGWWTFVPELTDT